MTNNLIFYQTIFNTSINKSISYPSSTIQDKINKTFNQHGLLIDKYLDKTIPEEDDYSNNSFTLEYCILFFLILSFFCLIYYYREKLVKSFRERHKRSVLKYSV